MTKYVPLLPIVFNRHVPDFCYVCISPLWPTNTPSVVPSAVIDGSVLNYVISWFLSTIRLYILFLFVLMSAVVKTVLRASIMISFLPYPRYDDAVRSLSFMGRTDHNIKQCKATSGRTISEN